MLLYFQLTNTFSCSLRHLKNSLLLGWVHTSNVKAYRNTVSWQCGRDSWLHNVSKVGYAVTLRACSVCWRYLAVASKGWYGYGTSRCGRATSTAYRNTVSWQCGRDSWPRNVSKVGLRGNVTGLFGVLSVFGRRIKVMIRLRPEQVWTCNVNRVS